MFCGHLLATLAWLCYAGATCWEGTQRAEKTGNLCITGSKGQGGTQVSWWPGTIHALFFPEMYQTLLSICGGLLHTFASERQEICSIIHSVSTYSWPAPSAASGLDNYTEPWVPPACGGANCCCKLAVARSKPPATERVNVFTTSTSRKVKHKYSTAPSSSGLNPESSPHDNTGTSDTENLLHCFSAKLFSRDHLVLFSVTFVAGGPCRIIAQH